MQNSVMRIYTTYSTKKIKWLNCYVEYVLENENVLFSSIGLSTITLNKNCGREESETANEIDEEKN